MNIPAGKNYVPRGSLPTNWKHAGTEARKAKKKRLPQWMWHQPTLERILGVYQDYLACKSLPFIANKYQISVTQIYRDIDCAQQEAKMRAELELETLAAQAIETRRSIIASANQTLDEMRAEMVAGPMRAQAEAQLLRVISDQATAIEQIQAVTETRRKTLAPQEAQINVPGAGPTTGVTLIINAAGVKAINPQQIQAAVAELPEPEEPDFSADSDEIEE